MMINKMIVGIITAGIVIAAGIWYKKNQSQTRIEKKETTYNKKAEEFVKRLDALGYFKYADDSDIVSLKENMIDNFDPDNELVTIWDDHTGTPKDFRYYFCDGETVYEEGGITGLLQDLQPTFQKLGFNCETTNHFEEWDDKNKWLNHSITINGTPYVIFKNFTGTGWGEAPKRIAEILNMELSKQGKDEKYIWFRAEMTAGCYF